MYMLLEESRKQKQTPWGHLKVTIKTTINKYVSLKIANVEFR